MTVRDDIVAALEKVSATFPVKRQSSISSDELDWEGTPDSNTNYGKPIESTPSDLDILMYCQHIRDDETLNGNYIEYQKRGYIAKGLLKIKSLEKLYEQDVITYSDGFKYEVFEKTDRYLPNLGKGEYQYTYTQAFALKQENQ